MNRALRFLLIVLLALVFLAAAWTWLTLHWSYSEGERAGYGLCTEVFAQRLAVQDLAACWT